MYQVLIERRGNHQNIQNTFVVQNINTRHEYCTQNACTARAAAAAPLRRPLRGVPGPDGRWSPLEARGPAPDLEDRTEATAARLLRRYGVVTILMTALAVLWWGMHSALSIEVVGNALYVTVIAVILAAEFWIPFRPEWGTIRNVTLPDVAYFLITPLTDALQMALLVGLLAATAQYLIEAFADTPEAQDPCHQKLIARALDDLARLCDDAKEHS